jgi:chloramphenicol O-acetyltransferase type A
MRKIDMKTWPRRKHFDAFKSWDQPHFNMCANVDLTKLYPAVKQADFSTITEFKYRIRGDEVVEHDVVHPSVTIMSEDDLFSFGTHEYIEKFSEYAVKAEEKFAYYREHPILFDGEYEDHLLYMTAIPWVSFTSFMHPHIYPVDSVPRFAWGKFFKEGDLLKMPLSIQAHHALMDGVHVGKFYQLFQEYLLKPDVLFK